MNARTLKRKQKSPRLKLLKGNYARMANLLVEVSRAKGNWDHLLTEALDLLAYEWERGRSDMLADCSAEWRKALRDARKRGMIGPKDGSRPRKVLDA